MKRFLTAVLSLMMVLTLLPVKAAAWGYPDSYNVHFVLADGTEVRTDYGVDYCYSVEAPAYAEVTGWSCDSTRENVAVGDRIWPDGEDVDLYFVADEVVPHGFNIRFEDAQGQELDNLSVSMTENDMAFYMPFYPDRAVVDFGPEEGWTIPDFWTAENLISYQGVSRDLVMDEDAYVSGDTLVCDYTWYESYPTVTFVAGLENSFGYEGEAVWPAEQEEPLVMPQLHTSSYPQTYNIHYVLQNGTEMASETCDYVNAFEIDAYKGVTTWTCDALDSDNKTVKTGETVWGDSFGMDRDVYFVADAVYADTFTLQFMNGTKCIKNVTVAYDDYNQITLPRMMVAGDDGSWDLADWAAEDGSLVLAPNDYVSGQTLDLDYVWYEANPVIVLNAVPAMGEIC